MLTHFHWILNAEVGWEGPGGEERWVGEWSRARRFLNSFKFWASTRRHYSHSSWWNHDTDVKTLFTNSNMHIVAETRWQASKIIQPKNTVDKAGDESGGCRPAWNATSPRRNFRLLQWPVSGCLASGLQHFGDYEQTAATPNVHAVEAAAAAGKVVS